MSQAPLLPGAIQPDGCPTTLGVMGGGQLGRMFVQAAQAMGFSTAVLDPDADSPAGVIAHHHVHADYSDPAGLIRLTGLAHAITTEFENVPAAALKELAESAPVAPGAAAVSICQDRAAEKAHFTACGVPCAPYAVISSHADLDQVSASLLPGILKTARFGYDGKGQQRVKTREELLAAFNLLGGVPCVLEQMLPLQYEVSVIVARNAAGDLVHFPLQQNLHRDGILAITQVPAPDLTPEVQQQAIAYAETVAASMQYRGVLCVEFFILQDGRVLANEMAPRPHNSGHYTLDATDVSQFELQVRAMTGLPLVSPRLHSPVVMINLLGDLWFRHGDEQVSPPWDRVLSLPGAHLHLYGKQEARKGRKMGHLNITGATPDEARRSALQACEWLGLEGF